VTRKKVLEAKTEPSQAAEGDQSVTKDNFNLGFLKDQIPRIPEKWLFAMSDEADRFIEGR
jgi:hypothetical protein